jgi:hypothetical protein
MEIDKLCSIARNWSANGQWDKMCWTNCLPSTERLLSIQRLFREERRRLRCLANGRTKLLE